MRVLLIDDDQRLFELLREYFAGHDLHLHHAVDGRSGLTLLQQEAFDAVLLDVMMPGMGGLEVLRRLRGTDSPPVIMLTARGDEADRIVGLELGADDYVAKPFSARELLARLRAVLRRQQPAGESERLVVGDVTVDRGTRRAYVGRRSVELTGIEFDVLWALMRRAGRIVPRQALLEEAGRGDLHVGERTVDVHVSKLRRKLGVSAGQPDRIGTVRGIGYLYRKDDA